MNTEVYASINGEDYEVLELTQKESILMNYVLKDTTNLSKIFSPFSQSFTFEGSLHNQKALGFVGMINVLKSKTNNTFFCKIYINGSLARQGLLKITDIREDYGKIQSFTGNFTTSQQSLQDRIGDDKISDLSSEYKVSWSNNQVLHSLRSLSSCPNLNPITKTRPLFYVPFISNNRVFQVNESSGLDNVRYDRDNRNGTDGLLINELSPAIQGRLIIDLIRDKYDLNLLMPLDEKDYYNDWFIYCNGEKKGNENGEYFKPTEAFGDFYVTLQRLGKLHPVPTLKAYTITSNSIDDTFRINYDITSSTNYDDYLSFEIEFYEAIPSTEQDLEITASIELLDGTIYATESGQINGGIKVKFIIRKRDFKLINGETVFDFKVKIKNNTPFNYFYTKSRIYYKYFTSTTRATIYQETPIMFNSVKSNTIDFLASIPEMSIKEFLTSFFKTFNISVFESSTTDNSLHWLTPEDLKAENKVYSKMEVDYTPYVVSRKIQKEIPNEYNYYNFKHVESKYKSNVDYKTARGFEFGQLTYPTEKPKQDLNEFKVETKFSILQEVPIIGIEEATTSYAFTSDAPEIIETGETRYKPNNEEFTIFFRNGIYRINNNDKLIAYNFNTRLDANNLSFNRFHITSPIHTSGFSFGFGLIQTATTESLYARFYKEQTERFLNPNTLIHNYKLELPADELVLNFSNTEQGESNIPVGFRLQNDVIIQDTRYSIIDATIDQTTGKTSIKLLNY